MVGTQILARLITSRCHTTDPLSEPQNTLKTPATARITEAGREALADKGR